MGATPFTEKILRAKLPKGFDKPTDMKYDGTKDPQEHLTAFEARMNLEGAVDAVRCRAFPVTLAGPAIKWFNALPNGSIASFHDITRKFMAQFTTRITKAKHPISLLGVMQKQEESTRKYLDCFNDECLTVNGLTDSVTSLCLTNGLMNKDFRKHLTTKPVWTMHEIQNVAKDYINDEEVSQVVAANKRQHGNTQHGNSAPRQNPPPRENQRDHPRPTNTNRPLRIGKFSNYTPLTAPITEVYHQIADRGIIPKARQLKERTGGNKTLYCDYHRGYGHKTQDCFNLKDALEQAIRDDLKVMAVRNQTPTTAADNTITFLPEDCQHGTSAEDAPFVISARIGTGLFRTEDGSIGTIHGDREVAAECDNTSLALRKKSRDAAGIFLADLDARQADQPRPEPEGNMEKLQIGPTKEEYTFINRNLPYDLKEELSQLLKQNRDLFAFTPADMPGINPDLMSHRLAVDPKAKPVAQRRRKMSSDRAAEVKKQVKALLEANFIRELPYTTWLANVVLVKKSNGKWRIFMDAYFGYNQIPMHCPDEEKTAFITPDGTYCYTVMPFGLKNAGATYQRLVNKIFQNLSGNKLEVYIDDMLVKTESGEQLTDDLKVIMNTLRKHQMRLNPAKCAFGMEAGKFLSFMITQRGVEANPKKCRAVLEMTSPKNLKDIQKLTGRLMALSRFLGASAQKAIPFFKLMKKGAPFKWETECEKAFQHFKRVLAEPPILTKPQTGETLYLYPSITEEALAAALIRENEKKEQKPVYFISRVLQDAEARYSRLEKLAFALLTASRCLRQYFQAHSVTVRTDQAVKHVLQKPDLAGRMLAWSIELSQFDIRFEPRYAIKAQAMADFIAEMTPGDSTPESWKLHVDGSSNITSGGAGVILESQNGAEYEALLAGLALAREVGAKVLEVNTDSQVVSSQINGGYQTRDPLLQQYLAKVNKLKEGFEHVTIQHVPRERNARADLLSKLASTKPGHGNKSLIQEVIKSPSVSTTTNAHLTLSNQGSWTHPILQYLLEGTLPPDLKEGKRIKREAANYTSVAGQLYKRGFSQPLLKCIEPGDTEYILREIHEGCCRHHVGGKTLAQKVIRAGYFWPTIIRDSIQIVKNCDKCQRHANIHQAAPHQLSIISAERPFGTWGIDLVRPFPTAPGQLRYLIVAIDYYTKWIEAEPLASITAAQCRKFLWRQIITRFGIPEIVISDNGTQFVNKKFREFLEGLHVSHRFSSVEHPQTNGQVESANKIIIKKLKKRLDEAKGLWADELGSVLWSYRTTPQTTT
nr:uncharacterized protein LOC112786044 [Arachis hypogaea]